MTISFGKLAGIGKLPVSSLMANRPRVKRAAGWLNNMLTELLADTPSKKIDSF
jgi:hypothetical protein